MTSEVVNQILSHYGTLDLIDFKTIGNGLIHRTFLVRATVGEYILQEINANVFQQPQLIAENLQMISHYLQQHSPGYLLVTPVKTSAGESLVTYHNATFRLTPFVRDSHTYNSVANEQQAFEAAKQFGRFTKELAGFDATRLNITIPDFHNLEFRFEQFEQSIYSGNRDRIAQAKQLINDLMEQQQIVERYQSIRTNGAFRLRVTHHDTKISNVLFDKGDLGLCVIDLDTVMAGFFISDIGDMMRTYLSKATEDAPAADVLVRRNIYDAIVDGYTSEMNNLLSDEEKDCIHYAGEFMIYMQALRFLTDYINNDRYYGCKYQQHNYNRALNQYTLLRQYQSLGQ